MARRKKKKTGLPYPKMKFQPKSAFSPVGAYHRWFKARILLPLLLKYGFPAFLFVTLPFGSFRYINQAVGNTNPPLSSGEITLHVIAYGIAFALAWHKYTHYMAYYMYVTVFHHAKINRDALQKGEVVGSPQHERRLRVNKSLLFPTPLELKYGKDVQRHDAASTRAGDNASAAQQLELLAYDQIDIAHQMARAVAERALMDGDSSVNDYLAQSNKYRMRCAPEMRGLIKETSMDILTNASRKA